MKKTIRHQLNFEETLLRIVPQLLENSAIVRTQFGQTETISVMTPSKLAEKFHIDVMYRCNAQKNGTLPIMSATFCSIDNPSVRLSAPVAQQLIRMCYCAEISR